MESVRTTRSRKSGLYWTLQMVKKEMFRFTFFSGRGGGRKVHAYNLPAF